MSASARDVWSVTGVGLTTESRPFGGEPGADVCTWRHDEYGTGIELWQGSFGWFDYVHTDGAPVTLCDTWAVQVERPIQAFSSAALYSRLKQQATKDPSLNKLPPAGASMGCWRAKAEGPYVVVTNTNSKRQRLVLTPDGFVFLGSRGRAVAVSQGGAATETDLAEALSSLPGLPGP